MKIIDNILLILILDQRGAKQEVTLSIKHGVETKNYEAVSNKMIEVVVKFL